MKIKWCVIGAGGIADRRTIPAIKADENNELVAVMDRVPTVAEAVGKKYGVKSYTDENVMLSENKCDAVYIGTPVSCHLEQALTVLKYGADCFIEKPVAMNATDGEKLLNAYKKAGKLLFVGYMMKYHNLNEKAKVMVQSGKIGQVSDVRLQFSCWYPDIAGAWRQKKSLGGGGAFMDLGVHCIELIEYVLGEEITEVKGFFNTHTFSYEVEDGAVMAFKTESGVLGHIDVNFNVPDNASVSKMELYGTKGYIICSGTLGQEETGKLSYLYAPQGDYSAQQSRTTFKPQNFYGKKGNLYLKQLKDFCGGIRRGKPDYSCAERAVQVQRIVDRFYMENGK